MFKVDVFILVWLFCANIADGIAWRKYIIGGESGTGKSSMLVNVFDVVEPVVIGHSLASETRTVVGYHTKDNSPHYKRYKIYDTPGFGDTGGLTDEQILELIKIEYLSSAYESSAYESSAASNSTIDGLILVVSALEMRDSCVKHLTGFVSEFGEEILDSLLVVINRFDSVLGAKKAAEKAFDIEKHLFRTLNGLLRRSRKADEYARTEFEIPVITMDFGNPTAAERQTLQQSLSVLVAYELSHLEHKKQQIEAIFNQMLLSPENYREQIDHIIKYEIAKVKAQELQTVVEMFDRTTVAGIACSFEGLGIKFGCGVKYAHEKIPMEVQHVVEVEREESVPRTEEEILMVLRNEEKYYWMAATQQYKKAIFDRFVGEH